MALLICPACGSPAVESLLVCQACQGDLTALVTGVGMMVAEAYEGATADAEPKVHHDVGSERQWGNRPWEAGATSRSQSAESIEESHADSPEPAASRRGAGGAAGVEKGPRIGGGSSPQIGDQPKSPRLPAIRGRVVVPAVVLVAAFVAFLAVAPGGLPRWAAAQRPQPTATAKPTATATAVPTPVVMPGFALYSDTNAGFSVQYPRTWTKSEDPNLFVQFDNTSLADSGTSEYGVQVSHPDPKASGVAAQADDNSTAAAWVDYELGILQQSMIAHGWTFSRVPGPIPAATIAGQTWQSGIANINEVANGQTLNVRLQVYATIHNGKPYIINVYALTDAFPTGSEQYFAPMLNSFKFLPPAA